MRRIGGLLAAALLCSQFFAVAGAALQAGAARVNISPRAVVDVPMSGYGNFSSSGLHDSLFARVLVLDDGDVAVAVATLDLIGLNVDLNPGSGRLPRLLRAEGMAGWLMVSTHTHGGPRVLDLSGPYMADRSWPAGDPYTSWVEERIIEAVRQAREELQPVRVAVAKGSVDISFNRRLVKANGDVEMIWGRGRQFSPEELGPTDPEVGVVQIEDLQGKPLAVLFNYACHAVVLGKQNRLLSADFPGYAMAYVERQFSGATGLFLQGAAGDLDPYIDVQNDFGPARDQGEELGQEVVRVARELAGRGGVDPAIEWIPLQRTFSRFAASEGSVTLHFGVLRLGPQLAFLTLPGEPFVELQLELKSKSPLPYTFLLGYANGYAGYFPTVQANREGGYGASWGGTMHVEPSAGEAMVQMALEKLNERIWVRALPDTLVSGQALAWGGVLRPVSSAHETPVVFADLGDLGGPERLPLAARADGSYELAAQLGPNLQVGAWEVPIYLQYDGGRTERYLRQRVVVLPGGNRSIWDGGMGSGWQVETSGGAAFIGVREFAGRSAAACRLEPESTDSVLDFWTLDFLAAAAVPAAGYEFIRLRLHPGTTADSASPGFSLYVNDRPIDLSREIDFRLPRWQEVEIPLRNLALEGGVKRLRFWGWTRGTFYLDDVAIISAAASSPPTQVGGSEGKRPAAFALGQNFPNPFNGATSIRFALREPGVVELALFDLAGQRVATLAAGPREAGTYTTRWDGRDGEGRLLASGVYLYRLQTGGGKRVETRKLVLIQ